MREERNLKNAIKEIFAWILTIVLAVAAAKVINTYVILKAEVPTGSMEHTIEVDDCILGFQLAYLFGDPNGGILLFSHIRTIRMSPM